MLVKLDNTSINSADDRSMSMGSIPESKIFGAGVVESASGNIRELKVGDATFGDLWHRIWRFC